MKLQQFISRVEELRASIGLYEELRGRVAQLNALEAMSALEELSDEQRAQLEETAKSLRTRHAGAVKLVCEKVGLSDIDEAINRADEIQARVEQIHQMRREQVNLRATLDLEMAMGQVPLEQRQQAEAALANQQQRMETALSLAEAMLPGSRLISLMTT